MNGLKERSERPAVRGASARRERADTALVRRGLADSREKAQALIMAGRVFSKGVKVAKSGHPVKAGQDLEVRAGFPYVGRGGLKLEEALDVLGVDVSGRAAADLGASTGGFTDCLLQRGARRVYAVDVDTRQLDQKLRRDPRVTLIEKNARRLGAEDFPEALDLVTADLSFISVLKVLPAVRTFLGEGRLLALLKPQFEAGRGEAGRGKGVVRDREVHARVLRSLIAGAADQGFGLRGLLKCSTAGQKGNREFFALWSLRDAPRGAERIERLVKEVVWDEKD
ncbi:MAG: TlyA family RNA methyltransferase [Candidatus Aminicenantes bacterium]|nr:TlyA family RNA methyltransferase [Candidatus Aminicenantes bacterium]